MTSLSTLNWPLTFGATTTNRARLPRFLRTPLLIACLLDAVMVLATLVGIVTLQPVVPLLYTLASPNDQLVAKEWLGILPLLAILITLLHGSILYTYRMNDTLLLKIFAWVTVAFISILSLELVRIMMLVG